ncbi:DUF2171 domain-containing protein [Deinococcus multiflagellatus]|uniref:DUF2171 domain-containing protein n=1 Tax=Deinococcus multiflagellatus TaxID=1656887 RepID=A0ABW1ZKZ9_9DEIO|nr:DUF2171 domain-containing protein [Deinococcus multiflagellatus]MBZ9713482.1 DUF2171 domain-containing protein [Deinococcus multiflagellatus]
MNEITQGMPIVCADGVQHGQVVEVDREYIRMRLPDDNRDHFVPLDTVAGVDSAVHLKLSHHDLLATL